MTMRNLAKKHTKQPTADLTKKNQSAILLIDSWLNEDEKEQKETFDYLKKSLDKDRLSTRNLFK